jgi:U4/U6 small nuclear ribonucleoprotein PRP4
VVLQIAQFSLRRAATRIAAAKQRLLDADSMDGTSADDATGECSALASRWRMTDPLARSAAARPPHSILAARAEQTLKLMMNQSSEVADERPIVGCQFSPDGSQLATGAWSGVLKVWSMPLCQKLLTIKAHSERITGVAWHPEASSSGRGQGTVALASAATDTTARLWSASGALLRTLTGHTDRLGRVAFHPMGRHLGTASFDLTWRFWDVETGQCLLEQEGHSRGVYTVAFQGDGALAGSGGMDAYGRVWDVRTGRSIMVLAGHVKAVLAMDFSPNGYLVATGSEDNTARVFDLRKKGVLAVLPGHTSLVSQVRFEPDSGGYLLTSGYDNVSKLWCGPKFKLARTLAGHEGKVMGSDVSPGGRFLVATAGYDRTLKLWHPDEHAAHAM